VRRWTVDGGWRQAQDVGKFLKAEPTPMVSQLEGGKDAQGSDNWPQGGPLLGRKLEPRSGLHSRILGHKVNRFPDDLLT